MEKPSINLESIIGLKVIEIYVTPIDSKSDELGGAFISDVCLLLEKTDDYLLIGAIHEIEDDPESNVKLDIKWSVELTKGYTGYGREIKHHKYLPGELGRVLSYTYDEIYPINGCPEKSLSITFQLEEGSILIYGEGPFPIINLLLKPKPDS
jgi:hypothetical protein